MKPSCSRRSCCSFGFTNLWFLHRPTSPKTKPGCLPCYLPELEFTQLNSIEERCILEIFFFHSKANYFSRHHWYSKKNFALCAATKIKILTLVLSENFFYERKKTIPPSLQVKWSVPYDSYARSTDDDSRTITSYIKVYTDIPLDWVNFFSFQIHVQWNMYA